MKPSDPSQADSANVPLQKALYRSPSNKNFVASLRDPAVPKEAHLNPIISGKNSSKSNSRRDSRRGSFQTGEAGVPHYMLPLNKDSKFKDPVFPESKLTHSKSALSHEGNHCQDKNSHLKSQKSSDKLDQSNTERYHIKSNSLEAHSSPHNISDLGVSPIPPANYSPTDTNRLLIATDSLLATHDHTHTYTGMTHTSNIDNDAPANASIDMSTKIIQISVPGIKKSADKHHKADVEYEEIKERVHAINKSSRSRDTGITGVCHADDVKTTTDTQISKTIDETQDDVIETTTTTTKTVNSKLSSRIGQGTKDHWKEGKYDKPEGPLYDRFDEKITESRTVKNKDGYETSFKESSNFKETQNQIETKTFDYEPKERSAHLFNETRKPVNLKGNDASSFSRFRYDREIRHADQTGHTDSYNTVTETSPGGTIYITTTTTIDQTKDNLSYAKHKIDANHVVPDKSNGKYDKKNDSDLDEVTVEDVTSPGGTQYITATNVTRESNEDYTETVEDYTEHDHTSNQCRNGDFEVIDKSNANRLSSTYKRNTRTFDNIQANSHTSQTFASTSPDGPHYTTAAHTATQSAIDHCGTTRDDRCVNRGDGVMSMKKIGHADADKKESCENDRKTEMYTELLPDGTIVETEIVTETQVTRIEYEEEILDN